MLWNLYIASMLIPPIFNYIIRAYKRKNTNEKLIEKLVERGYKIDEKYESNLLSVIKSLDKFKDIEEDLEFETFLTCICPLISLWQLYSNIKYFKGNSSSELNRVYSRLENLIDDKDSLKELEKHEIVKKDEDKNNTLRKLEDKYDNSNIEEKNTFSKNDSMDELYSKMANLQELIERKENNENEKLNKKVLK